MTPADRRALATRHLPLLFAMAREMSAGPDRFTTADLIGAGAVGLCVAARRFDPVRGVPFAGFAAVRIRGAMVDWMRLDGPYNRGAVRRLRAGCDNVLVGLDAIADLPDHAPLADERIADQEAYVRARLVIAAMEPRTRRLMDLMYVEGLDGKTAGEAIGISKPWACQLRQRAIRELREAA